MKSRLQRQMRRHYPKLMKWLAFDDTVDQKLYWRDTLQMPRFWVAVVIAFITGWYVSYSLQLSDSKLMMFLIIGIIFVPLVYLLYKIIDWIVPL